MQLFKSNSGGNIGVLKKAIDPGIKLAVYMGQQARKNKKAQQLKEQLAIGIKVEMEHTKDPKEARKIALDHLKEHKNYYTRLVKEFGKSVGTMLYLDIFKGVPIKGRPGLQLVQTAKGKRWKRTGVKPEPDGREAEKGGMGKTILTRVTQGYDRVPVARRDNKIVYDNQLFWKGEFSTGVIKIVRISEAPTIRTIKDAKEYFNRVAELGNV